MIVQLSVTADCCQQKLFGLSAMADDRRAVRYKLEDCGGLFCSLPSLGFFSQIIGFQDAVMQIILSHSLSVAYCTSKHYKVGGVTNRSLISAHFSVSAYFLTIQIYKLTTQVYSIYHMRDILFSYVLYILQGIWRVLHIKVLFMLMLLSVLCKCLPHCLGNKVNSCTSCAVKRKYPFVQTRYQLRII